MTSSKGVVMMEQGRRLDAGALPGDTRITCEQLADGGSLGLARGFENAAVRKGPCSGTGGKAKRRVRKRGPAPKRIRAHTHARSLVSLLDLRAIGSNFA
jgi:hypothetical protein